MRDIVYKSVFPLVSILIPTYNQTNYLRLALDSAINQTYGNTEIIICDDSTTKDVQILIEEYMENSDKIKYYNNGGPLGKHGNINIEKCLCLAKGEYISFLLHDDEYYPTRIEKMVNKFQSDKSITLVTSSRNCINADGKKIKRVDYVYNEDMNINGNDAAKNILFSFYNFIGEFTTVMFRKSDALIDGIKLNEYFKSEIKCLTDISLYLKLCSKGNLFFISEPLSKFRMHFMQNTFDKSIIYYCPIDFFNIIIDSYEVGLFINSEEELKLLIYKWMDVYKSILVNSIKYLKSSEANTKELERFISRLKKYDVNINRI